MSYRIRLLCLFGLALAGCSTLSTPLELPVRTLARTHESHFLSAREMVIRDAATWQKVWNEHVGATMAANELPRVDFSIDMVILVGLGQKKTGGYDVDIVGAQLAQGHLRILIQQRVPENERVLLPQNNSPVDMVAIPRSSLKPEFVNVAPF